MSTDTIKAQLLSQLECPVCMETCVPPIYMCYNGHGVCTKCQAQLNECSTCRAPGKPTLRSVQLEKIAALLEFPCANQPHGCDLILNVDELAKHVLVCEFGFNCHFCTAWKGSARDLKEHVQENHHPRYFPIAENGATPTWKCQPANKEFHDKAIFYLFSFNDDIFWFESKYTPSSRIFSNTLRIVSHEARDAARYYYSVEFESEDKASKYKVFQQADVLTEGATPEDIASVIPASIIGAKDSGLLLWTLKILQNAQ